MQLERIDEMLAAIDRELERPPISIEDAVAEAVVSKRMTEAEATECIDAYQRTFH